MRRFALRVVISGLGLTMAGGASAAAPPALPTESPSATPSADSPATGEPPPAEVTPATDASAPADPAPGASPPNPNAGLPPAGEAGEADLGGSLDLDTTLAKADDEAGALDPTGPGMVRGRPEPMMNSLRGPVGLYNTSLAAVGGPMTFRFRIHSEFFRRKGFIYDNPDPTFGADEHARVRGAVNLGFTPWKYLELFFSINSQANRNSRTQPVDTPRQDSETMFALGDVDFGTKFIYALKDGGVGLGLDLGLGLLSGTQRLRTSSVNFWFDAVFGVDLRYLTKKHAPVRITANIGWMLDNSLKLIDWERITDTTSREVTRFALGVNHSRVRMRYALDFPIRIGKEKQAGIDPIIEWSWDVSTASDDAFEQPGAQASPLPRSMQWLTLGLRGNVVSGLHLDAAVDVGIVSPNFERGPPVPPWQLLLGLGWSFDPKPVVKEVEVPAEPSDGSIGAQPVLEGRIVGQVINPDGSAVAGAQLYFPGLTTTAVMADEGGNFTTFQFPAGTVAIQVQSEGQVVWEGTAEVVDGEDAQLAIQLDAAPEPPTGIVEGAFTNANGQPIKISMKVSGQGVDEPFQSTEGGLIALELFAGEYSAVVSAAGYKDKSITFTVQGEGKVQVSAQLESDAPPDTPNIKGKKQRISVRKGIRYRGNEVSQKSHAILDELATFLTYHSKYAVIEIGVHSDDRGNPRARTQGRADAVRAYLMGKGVSPDRIQAKGYGDSKPVAVNMTAVGRAKNNRTEIRVKKYTGQ